jgi:hypothetical protein
MFKSDKEFEDLMSFINNNKIFHHESSSSITKQEILGAKKCSSCQQILNLNDFVVDKNGKKGRRSSCKECDKKKRINSSLESLVKSIASERNLSIGDARKVALSNLQTDKKICSVCNLPKHIDDFVIDSHGLKNRRSSCKDCDKLKRVERIKNKEIKVLMDNLNISREEAENKINTNIHENKKIEV